MTQKEEPGRLAEKTEELAVLLQQLGRRHGAVGAHETAYA
jgi:hypothetical protein